MEHRISRAQERRHGKRRKRADRRTPRARRAGQSERVVERRAQDLHVAVERRAGWDRRRIQRRLSRRRRAIFDRRVADRREDKATGYSRQEVDTIRRLLSTPSVTARCPKCKDPLHVGVPRPDGPRIARTVVCTTCGRMVTLPDCTMARILVVDDGELVRHALRTILTSAGHEVIEASNGDAGIRSYRETPADVVMVDMTMPVLDGAEFIRQCRRTFPTCRIIAMSGGRRHGAPDPLATARHLGAVKILRKPFGRDDVLPLIDELLGVVPAIPAS